MDFNEVYKTIVDGGPLGILLLILWGGSKQIWVWGYQYREMKEDRDRWRDLALAGTDVAEKAVEVVRSRGVLP
jgi:hypothetical protein